MPVPARTLRIGSYGFDLAEKNAHSVAEVDLGPTGEVQFSLPDWARGLQTVEQGLNWDKSPSYVSARGCDAAFPGQIILQPQAVTIAVASGQPAIPTAPVKQVDFTVSGTTNTYLGAGRYVYRLDSNNQWTQVLDLGAGISVADMVVHGGKLVVAYSTGYRHTTDGTTWTNVATAADRFGVLGQNVWRAVRPNSLYSASDVTSSWSSAYTVADSSFNVNSIVGLEQLLMVGKEDGIYSIDSEGVVTPFTPELRVYANSNFASVRAATTFNQDYYFRTLDGIVMISGQDGQKRRVGLDQLASPDLPTPRIIALAGDDRYLYALCANSSNDLMILRRNIYGAWHVFYWDGSSGTKQGQHLAISSALGYPALFFSYFDNASTYTTRYIRLAQFPNPRQDSNYRYDTASSLWIRFPRFVSADTPAVFDRCTIQSQNLTAGVTITPYYAVDGGAVTQFGSTAATGSPLSSISLGTPVSGHLWDFYVYLSTNTNTSTPVLTGISFKGQWKPQRRRVHTYYVLAAAYQPTRRAGRLRRSAVDVLTDLRALRETTTYQSVVDENDQSWSALVSNVSEVTQDADGNDEPDRVFKVTLIESVAAVAANTFTYGTGVYG